MTIVAGPRLFGVVPAAGVSCRMGQPKLLLPFGESTVIARMLAVLARPEVEATVVVIRPDDEPLRATVAACGAIPVQPEFAPAEMRHSVEFALSYIEGRFHPTLDSGWILAPGDHPLFDSTVIDRLISAWRASPDKILVPVYRGKRGHPTLFPYRLAQEVFGLPPEVGLNSLLKQQSAIVDELEIESPGIIADLDTPEDYARLLDR